MAHRYKVEATPHRNANGTLSKTKKDYLVYDKGPKKNRRLVGTVTSQKAAQYLIDVDRKQLLIAHLEKNPEDRAFVRKHGINTNPKGI